MTKIMKGRMNFLMTIEVYLMFYIVPKVVMD